MALVLYQHRQDGRFARTWSTRSMAMWVLVLLLGFLILYYV
jgi:multicomponent Na+:H+ antiporter subunit D